MNSLSFLEWWDVWLYQFWDSPGLSIWNNSPEIVLLLSLLLRSNEAASVQTALQMANVQASAWRLACHLHLSSLAQCPLSNLECDLCFPSTFHDLLPCRNCGTKNRSDSRSNGTSLPCGTIRASLLDRMQTPVATKNQRGKAGICQSQACWYQCWYY